MSNIMASQKNNSSSDSSSSINTFGKAPITVISGIDSLSSFGAFDPKLKLWRRELPLASGESIRLLENPNDATDGGEFFIWPASLVLSNFLMKHPSLVQGCSIIELGASHGMASMVASSLGASFVAATDRQHVMPFLRSNLALNPQCRLESETD
jgi:hypothetical protein